MNKCAIAVIALAVLTQPALGLNAKRAASAIEQAVATYNELHSDRPALALSTDGSDGSTEYALPAWLAAIDFTPQEASALVAAVSAFGADHNGDATPAARSGPSVASTIVALPLAMVAYNLQQRAYMRPQPASLTAPQVRSASMAEMRAFSPSAYKSMPVWTSPEQNFTALIVDMQSCNGAFSSALAKLEDSRRDEGFTTFVRSVRRDLATPALQNDAECKGGL